MVRPRTVVIPLPQFLRQRVADDAAHADGMDGDYYEDQHADPLRARALATGRILELCTAELANPTGWSEQAELILRTLAAIYEDHEHYNPEWAL